MTREQKRKELEARGWSPKRIEQYLRDWRFYIPRSFNPKSQSRGSCR